MMKLFKTLPILLGTIATITYHYSVGQSMSKVPMSDAHWTVKSDEYRFEEYLGVQCVYLPKGSAQLNDVIFRNGIIEFDIAFPQGRGFPGVLFRMQDDTNYEEFYIRPHQSGNPDANQYTPVFNGLAGWQLYYGEGHAAPVKYKYDAWNHVKIIIKGTVGEVYINDMEKPLFQIYELKHGDVDGPIALKGNAKSRFANFSYQLTDNSTLKLPVKEIPSLEQQVIGKYQVSNVVADNSIIGKTQINSKEMKDLVWADLIPEYTGTINIARIAKRSENKNTALVKITISSDEPQIKRLDFGFSKGFCSNAF